MTTKYETSNETLYLTCGDKAILAVLGSRDGAYLDFKDVSRGTTEYSRYFRREDLLELSECIKEALSSNG